MESRTIVSAKRFDSAFYEVVRFESVIQAQGIVGGNPSIQIWKDKKTYLTSEGDSAEYMAHLKQQLSHIEEGVPFAIIIEYVKFYVPLDENKHLVSGVFPNYHGEDSKRWVVLNDESLKDFISLSEAKEIFNGKS